MIRTYTKKESKQLSSQQRWNITHKNKVRKAQRKYFVNNRKKVNYKTKLRIRRLRERRDKND